MAKEPADRYETGAELVETATAALPQPKRSRWQLVAFAILAITIVAVAAAIPAVLLTGGGEDAAPAGNPNPTTHAVQRIDAETGALAATVELRRTADGIAATDKGVYVFDKSGQVLLPVDPDMNAIGEPILLDAVAAAGRVQRVTGRADSLFVMGGGPCETGGLCPVKSFVPETGSFAEVNGIKNEGATAIDPPVDAFGDVWFLDSFGTFAHSTLVRNVDGVSPTATISFSTEEFPESGGAAYGVDERSLSVLTASSRLVDATSRASLGEAMALWRIDPDTLDVSTTTVGGTPTGIVAAGDSVWVTVRP